MGPKLSKRQPAPAQFHVTCNSQCHCDLYSSSLLSTREMSGGARFSALLPPS